MQSVIETSSYLAAADQLRIDEEERAGIIDMVAANPSIGEVMPGCGGARKVRVRRPGGGKSGGYRLITYFGGNEVPVFLLTIFGKGEKANLTMAERNDLAKLTKLLRDSLSQSIGPMK